MLCVGIVYFLSCVLDFRWIMVTKKKNMVEYTKYLCSYLLYLGVTNYFTSFRAQPALVSRMVRTMRHYGNILYAYCRLYSIDLQ